MACLALHSNMLLVPPHPPSGKVLSDARLKIEQNLYLHYITESIYVT